MKRRDFVSLVGCAAVWPFAARAQRPAERVHRVAVWTTLPPVSDIAGLGSADPAFKAFVQAMRDLGYVEGRNLALERWEQQTRVGRYGEIAADLVRRKLDIVVTIDNATARAMKGATNIIPIIMAGSTDPVKAGIVASLARPGGNITGFTSDTVPEFEAKRLQLLKEALPDATRITYLGLKNDWESREGASIRAAAPLMGVSMALAEQAPSNYSDAFAFIVRDRPHALLVAPNPMNFANRQVIADFATEQRLPGMYPYRQFVEAGGLMSYGIHLPDLFRRAAGHVDKILKGGKPADIPVEQPTRFELVINGKTARALGLSIPPSLIGFADEVIE